MDKLRIDKWLWAAGSTKTRSLATDELNKAASVNGQVAKPSREVRPGDWLRAQRPGAHRENVV
jgi:ribosome-associated heat shock protein Hsp15